MKALLIIVLFVLPGLATASVDIPEPFMVQTQDYYLFDVGSGLYLPITSSAKFTSLIMRHPIGGLMG